MNNDNTIILYPNRDDITETVIQYWEYRLETTLNPILKARYAGLLWDFYKSVCKKNAKINFAQRKIDSIIEIAKLNLHKYEINTISKLKQAINLAIKIKDNERINKVKNTILQYEIDIIKGDKAFHAWAISYDRLLYNEKIKLSPDEERGIIERIEDRLTNLVQNLPNTPAGVNAIKESSLRLANYYGKKHEVIKQIQSLNKYFNSVIKQAEVGTPLQAQIWLSEAYRIMKRFNQKENMKEIALKLQTVNHRLNEDLHTVSTSIEIPKEKIEQHIAKMTSGDLELCLKRITFYYIDKKSDIEIQVKELAKNYPFRYTCNSTLTDSSGRPIAIIGTLEEDLEGHITAQMRQNIQVRQSCGFMRTIINTILNNHGVTIDQLKQYIYQSPLFQLADKKIFEYALYAYLIFDPIGFLHTAIPQIENMLRGLVEQSEQPVIKERRNGGFNLLTFDEILRNDTIYKTFGEDISFYLRVVFTDQRGLNLRNNICHGITLADELSMENADIVFHVILILAALRPYSIP